MIPPTSSFASKCYKARYEYRLIRYRKGIADEELARKEAERGRERKPDADASGSIRTRSRSASSYTSTSVSTISTNRSHSPSRRTSHIAERKYGGARSRRRSFSPNRREARTSSSSAVSHASKSSHARPSNGRSRRHDDTRHQRSMSRHGEHAPFPSATRKRQRESSSSSRSYSSDYSMRRQRRDRYGDGARGGDRNTRRRRSSVSPDTRGRDRSLPRGAGKRRTMSRSDSMDRSRVAQGRHSMTPTSPPLHPLQARANGRGLARNTQHRDSIRRQDQNAINPKVRSSTRNGGGGLENRPQQALPLRKERSLSPFSKRLALTQAMNMGHR